MSYDDFNFETQEDEKRKQQHEDELNAATLAGAKLGAQWGAQAAVSQVAAALEPYAPAVVELTKQKTLAEVSRGLPQFRQFYGSAEYHDVLERHPALRRALENAEADPVAFQKDLPELYKMASDLHQASQQASTPQRRGESPRETSVQDAGPDLSTSEKRKAFIQALESRGIKDADLDRADPSLGRKGGR